MVGIVFAAVGVSDLSERGHVRASALVEDDVIDEGREARVALRRHLFIRQSQVGVGRFAVVDLSPEGIPRDSKAAVPIAKHREAKRSGGCRVDPALHDRDLLKERLTRIAGRALEAAGLEVDAEETDRRIPDRSDGDVDSRSELGISERGCGDVGVPI